MNAHAHLPPYRASRLFIKGLRAILAAITVAFLVLAPLSYCYPDSGFAWVKEHFDEPASVYPAASVALFLMLAALLTGLACYYLTQVLRLLPVDPARLDPQRASVSRASSRMAWALLAMCIVILPMGTFALEVETAFKGPTSEVTRPWWIVTGLALIGAFALAHAVRNGPPATYEGGKGEGG